LSNFYLLFEKNTNCNIFFQKTFFFRSSLTLVPDKGFTLIEILAAVSIAVLLFSAVFGLYFFGVNTFQICTAHLDLQQNVRIAADFITRELRYARNLEVDTNEVQYQLPDDDDNNSYTIKKENGEIVYLINSTENKIAYNISTLSFTWDGLKKILSFEIEGVDNRYRYAVRTAVCLQNLRERR